VGRFYKALQGMSNKYPVAFFNPCEGLTGRLSGEAAEAYVSQHLQTKLFLVPSFGFEFRINQSCKQEIGYFARFNPNAMAALSVFQEFLKTLKFINSKEPKPSHVKKFGARRLLNFNGKIIYKARVITLKTTLIICTNNRLIYTFHEHKKPK
jgi:hypothetical protein